MKLRFVWILFPDIGTQFFAHRRGEFDSVVEYDEIVEVQQDQRVAQRGARLDPDEEKTQLLELINHIIG